ncbi:hypothetical protein CS542_06325 [Pedobacter sp. IW39]|nr:hypothetical protein CS542_06325 [Pedobacter sp. IW39]
MRKEFIMKISMGSYGIASRLFKGCAIKELSMITGGKTFRFWPIQVRCCNLRIQMLIIGQRSKLLADGFIEILLKQQYK